MKLVSYYYYDDQKYARKNLELFFSVPLCENCRYLIYSVEQDLGDMLPETWKENPLCEVKVVENKLFDFQGFKESLRVFVDDERLSSMVILNSTVAGPFVPAYCMDNWVDLFTSKLSKTIGLVGSNVSVLDQQRPEGQMFAQNLGTDWPCYPHVQTYSFALSRAAALTLEKKNFFGCIPAEFISRYDAISYYELWLSVFLLKNNFEIEGLLPGTNAKIDGSKLLLGPNLTFPHCDYMFPNSIAGRSPSPYEMMFIKTRRNIYSLESLLSFRQFGTSNMLNN